MKTYQLSDEQFQRIADASKPVPYYGIIRLLKRDVWMVLRPRHPALHWRSDFGG